MEPISRRRALQLGGLGLALTTVGGVGVTRSATTTPFDPETGSDVLEPPVLRSTGGTLQVRLEAALVRTRVAGRDATVLGYNGVLPGPTLYLQPGDRLQVELVNRLSEPTNLHLHGLHVSPEGNGDNVFRAVDPGHSFGYDYQLPAHHPPGVFWYHPHHHGLVADQVFGGLYGALIVGDPTPVPVTRERVLVVSDISLDASGRLQQPSLMNQMMGREGDLVLLNGQSAPRLRAAPGERERWRVINACPARYLRLRLDGHQFHLLGIDSGRYRAPQQVEEVVLATGNRADLLVTTTSGTSALRTVPYDRGSMAAMMGMGGGPPGGSGMPGMTGPEPGAMMQAPSRDTRVLATVDVTGPTAAPLPEVPAQPAPGDLRTAEVTGRRALTFAMSMGGGGMRFTIDGNTFDPARTDHTVRTGSVEEWTLINTSPMDHPVHLHVWPMQLIERAGQPVDAPTWQDVVNVPAGSTVTVRVAFDTFSGRTVYHCHILDHEDRGMMGVIQAR